MPAMGASLNNCCKRPGATDKHIGDQHHNGDQRGELRPRIKSLWIASLGSLVFAYRAGSMTRRGPPIR